jgi:hypothetical protein
MKLTLASIIALHCAQTLACSPGRNIDIYFDPNSSNLKSAEILRLADWDIGNKLHFPNHDFLQIAGIARADEKNARTLSKERARVVAEYFRRTHYDMAPIIVENAVYPHEATGGEDFRRAELMMAPLPPNGCSG